MEDAWAELKSSISLANRLNKTDEELAEFHSQLKTALHSAVTQCRHERKRKLAEAPRLDLSDESVLRAARFTDHLPLKDYAEILHLCPRLVNVVTLAEAVPVPGSGVTLPLDLHAIAARCTNAYYAPRRFAAVQLAFSNPRCRVLIFHTGRLVGTGCSGPMQARMAILKAARQLAVEANLRVHIRKFNVINQVGAVGIDAKLDCDAFASTHSATSHYDRASFVGACSTKKVWWPLTGLAGLTGLTACNAQVWRGGQEAKQCAVKYIRRERPTSLDRRGSATC
jgi:TATA-box binding protein (TBP) (component of TFIID and TFIIIB)